MLSDTGLAFTTVVLQLYHQMVLKYKQQIIIKAGLLKVTQMKWRLNYYDLGPVFSYK